jgi:proteasome lid subunit RPN8/RPN11
MKFYIKTAALEFILGVSGKTYPREFTALLRGGGDMIDEVLLIPGTMFGEDFATIRMDMKPLDATIIGSVHSHPSRSFQPSEADISFFGKTGFIHLIVRYPYKSIADIAAYDLSGGRLELEARD